MLIPFSEVVSLLQAKGISIKGILHVGANDCGELPAYNAHGIPSTAIDWIEADPSIVAQNKERGIFVHCAAISDVEAVVPFHIANNGGQSSSLLDFKDHSWWYPDIVYTNTINVHTQTLANFITRNNINIKERNFWNLDIQGTEFNALKSAGDFIDHADAIYCEINFTEIYKGCVLFPELNAYLESRGFKAEKFGNADHGWTDALFIRVPKN